MSQLSTKLSTKGTRFWSWLRTRADTPKQFFITNACARIFLVSFTTLFFELLCIRWVPSYVRYLSYFNNFILLASFLGIGLGMLVARRSRFWYPPFALLVLLLVVIVGLNRFELRITMTDVIYYAPGKDQSASVESFIVLPIIFGMVTACFIPLGRALGQLFTQVKPLTAYTFDILGSLTGIACFSTIAFFSLPPYVWFAILALLILLLSTRRGVLAVAVVSIQGAFLSTSIQDLPWQLVPPRADPRCRNRIRCRYSTTLWGQVDHSSGDRSHDPATRCPL